MIHPGQLTIAPSATRHDILPKPIPVPTSTRRNALAGCVERVTETAELANLPKCVVSASKIFQLVSSSTLRVDLRLGL